jgi:uncharacterized protein
MNRREMLKAASAVLGLSAFPLGWTAAAEPRRQKVLYFTRSVGYEHSVVHRTAGKLAWSERVLTEMGAKTGFDVVCTQDGAVFDGDLHQYDAIAFYTNGDLISPEGTGKPMTAAGKKRLLAAIAGGKAFVGIHPCTNSFTAPGDPYMAMLGGQFVVHGPQQKARLAIVSQFPGTAGIGSNGHMSLLDEWYVQKNFARDLHVILVQETKGMQGKCYQRPNFPSTWARREGKGRVFYTSLGHREDVWTGAVFQAILLGGFAWAMGNVDFDVKPNIDRVTPQANS